MSRQTRIPERRWEAFLEALRGGATVSAAYTAARISRGSVYERRRRDEDFALRWADALEEGTEVPVGEATRRAMENSDTLLIFLLKARQPEVYRERWAVKHSGTIEARPSAELLADARARGMDLELQDAMARFAAADAAYLRRQAEAEGQDK